MAYEYHLSPTLAAQEGDTSVLCERLRNSAVTITMAERRCAADLIEKLKPPRKRPPSLSIRLRDIDIARHVQARVDEGQKTEAAVASACEVFKCKRAVVFAALKAHPVS